MMMVWLRKLYGRLHPLRWRQYRMRSDGEGSAHLRLGAWGERVACLTLMAQGGKVLYRNFRPRQGGEVDVVVRDGETLCFVEVKTRQKRREGRPLDAVNREKQELIERGARAWRKLLGHEEYLWRFDVVEVMVREGEPPEVVWVKGAF